MTDLSMRTTSGVSLVNALVLIVLTHWLSGMGCASILQSGFSASNFS
ncbi:MAG: hypothetical protein LBR83_08000 [Clostridiales bacterium]|nr:hypothetical protein [Clostridiales bacterium]